MSGSQRYPANYPCEDREVLLGFDDVKGGAIFDGHGGWKISDFLARYIHTTIKSIYAALTGEKSVADRLR
jgi:hypothetical protein